MIDDSSPVHSELERILNEIFTDILNSNHSLNRTVLQLICEFIGKHSFYRHAATNEHRERLFVEFMATVLQCVEWRYYDGHQTYYAVKVNPQDVDFVLQNAKRPHPADKWTQRTMAEMNEQSVESLYRQLFVPRTEEDLYSWTAYDWSYAANRFYPSTDPQRSVQRSYIFAKPKHAEGARTAMYGIMYLSVYPS